MVSATMKSLGFAVISTLMFAAGCGKPAEPSAPVAAPAPGFKDIVLTDDANAKAPKTTFKPDTATIYVYYGLQGAKKGDKAKGVWIAEKAANIPEIYEIDQASVDLGPEMNVGDFSISKPTKGWPVGSYRIDMYWNDKVLESRKFTIEK